MALHTTYFVNYRLILKDNRLEEFIEEIKLKLDFVDESLTLIFFDSYILNFQDIPTLLPYL